MASDEYQIVVKLINNEGSETLDSDTAASLNRALVEKGKQPLDENAESTIGQTMTLVVKSCYSMDRIREMIQARHSDNALYEKANMRLIFAGKQLEDPWATLADHNIQALSTIHLVLRLRGGAPK